MTQDEIIEMARQAGIIAIHTEGDGHWHQQFIALESFAKLVAAHARGQIFKPDWDNYCQGLIDGAIAEREECAKVCDDLAELNRISETDSMWEWAECAAAIRARGNV